jgi:hypothetical protein
MFRRRRPDTIKSYDLSFLIQNSFRELRLAISQVPRLLKCTLQICVYGLNFLPRIKLRLCWCSQHSKESSKRKRWGSVRCPASRWVGGSKERMQEKTQDKERVNMRWGQPSTGKTHVIKLEPVQTDQPPGVEGEPSAAHLQEFAACSRP